LLNGRGHNVRGRLIGVIARHGQHRDGKSKDRCEHHNADAARMRHDSGTGMSEFMGVCAGTESPYTAA
jgi:hypothetical protein